MEDSQVAVAQATNGTEYPSAGKFPAEYTLSSDSTLGCEDHAPPVSSADVVNAETDGSNLDNENVYSHGASSITGDSTLGVYETKIDDRVTGASENLVIQENVAVPSIHEYDAINGITCESSIYESAAVPGNGSLSNEEGGHVIEQQFDEVYSAEEGRLWNMVRADCLDFNSWTALIEETERVAESDILKIRNVYDAFLAEFPLCFGYWKKYADHEGRLDSVDKVVEVYERAVLAVTYSVEIWQHYCVFAISTYEDPDTIRRLFERGLAYVGTDYLSYPLWDEYIRFEESHQNWSHLAMIYSRILENPIQQLDRYFNCFKELASSRPLSEIWTPEEAAMVAATMDSGAHVPQGEILIEDAEQSSKPVSEGLMEAEELEKYIAIREEMYKKAKEFDSKIISFETAIRRPYFHVRPLDDPELDNWHNYLDFIEAGDDFNKVVKLYERCLIACASYPKYWIRYVLSMEASGSMQLALNALARATQVFVKRQPEIHLFAARFKELNGDVLGARTEYELLYSEISPCLLEAIVKHANMEYRLGHKEASLAVYERIIASEQEKEHSQILPMLLVQYSRFLLLVAANVEKAMEIIEGALGHAQLSKPLLEAIIHLNSIQRSPRCVGHLDSLVEKFITLNDPKVASTTEREEISCIFLEFLDLFGDAESIRKAENRHNMLFLCQKSTPVSKKRHAEDYLVSDKAKMAATYSSVPSSAQSVMGPYPNVQNQWPAGNEQRTPAWPPTSQTQSQQWNYGQQADYSGYGYANYGHPQVPPSAPQAAAYGPYPPTYPTQAYPQQSYAQPTSGTTFPPQQTAAPQQQPYFPYY